MKRSFGISLFLTLSACTALAQAGFGGLAGTVTDPTHAVIPSATVTLTGANGESRTTKTNGVGRYEFTALPVEGAYTVTVTAPGFATGKVIGLSTTVGVELTQNVALAVGAEKTTVVVSAASVEQVQLDSSSVSQLIDRTVFQDSPLEYRTQNQFVFMVAGAAQDQVTDRGAAMDGARSGTGNFLVEGMDNNDQGQGGGGFIYGTPGAVTSISPDAVQEYRVITHNPEAEYGRAGGFATDTVLKSGGNEFHGSLFEYNRVQALAAEHWFSNYAEPQVRDHLVRNQFGGSLGGPIKKDKTFFYASVEIHHVRSSAPVTGTVTTQAFLNFVDSGAFETFQEENSGGLCVQATGYTCPGAFNDAHALGPVFKKLLAAEPGAFPLGTQNETNLGNGLYTCQAPCGYGIVYPVPVYATATKGQNSPTDENRATLKIDHRLTKNDQLSFAYLLDQSSATIAFGGGAGYFGPDLVRNAGAQLFTSSWTHTFSPSLLNVFHAGYTRHVSNRTVPSAPGVPEIAPLDLYSSFGASANDPQLFTENEFLYEDSLTKVVGKHTVKAGFRFIRTRNGSNFATDENGTLWPWDTESLVTDETFDDQADEVIYGGPAYGSLAYASAAIDSTNNLAPNPYRGYRANEFAAYAQDDWKVTSRLMLNLGVRWEYFGPPHNFQAGLDSNVFFGAFTAPTPNGNPFLPNTPFMGAMQGATSQVVPNAQHSSLWNKDTNNFAPRVGFSYDPTGSGKMAIRGGFGIGYDRLYNNAYENIRFNSPHYADNSIGYYGGNGTVVAGALEQPALVNIPFTANNLFAAYGGIPSPRQVDQRLVTAYYEQANFGVEKEIAKGYVAEVNYIGTFGRKLVGLKDANTYDGRTACPTLTPTCVAAGFTSASSARPNTSFGTDYFRTNGFNSSYNALQVSVRKGYANGLMFLANYTYGKTLDEISDIFSQKAESLTGITDALNPRYDYGPADFDVRHMASITLNYESQWRKDSLLLGGWGISPIITLQSGSPFSTIDSFYNPNQDGDPGIDRVVYTGTGSYKSAISHNPRPSGPGYLQWSQFADYSCPSTVNHGLWCDPPMSRNAFYGPGYEDVDVAVSKHIAITERQRLTAQVSFFNLLNHPNFDQMGDDYHNPETFGFAQGTKDPRTTQLSLRYDF